MSILRDRPLLALVAVALLAGYLIATESLPGTSTGTTTATATATTTEIPTPTDTPAPTAIPVLIATPIVVAPAPSIATPIAEPARGGNFDALPLPDGVTVRTDGCSVSYGCTLAYNYYDAGSREIVLQGEQLHRKVVHEYLHAHQHWSIGRELSPAEYDLQSWTSTDEGVSFIAVVGVPTPWPWPTESYATSIEAFAVVGSYWYTDPAQLQQDCPVCYDWAKEHLP